MQIDFYLLETSQTDKQQLFICKLIEKAYLLGHSIFIFCASENIALQLDELLWTFKPESFIPHNIQGEGPEPPPIIQLGYSNEPRGFSDILINLSPQIPSFYHKFQRVIEVIKNSDDAKELARTRYKSYRADGKTVKTHQITAEQTQL